MDRKRHGTSPCPAEFRDRAVQMAAEHRSEHRSLTAAAVDIARKPGCSADALRVWRKRSQRDAGEAPGAASAEKARIKALERENRELRQANEILKKGEPLERHWSERQWRTRISPKGSSTARTANDGLH